MEKTRKLIIGGDSLFAEIAYEYFTHDSEYEVVAFAVEKDYITRDVLFGIPVVPFETLEDKYTPNEHFFYSANVYTQLNRLRTRLYQNAKARGYAPASYISPRAFVWHNVEIGEHCFIFEDNVIQPFVKIGNNVILWSGNHIGHHTTIKDNVFISSHVVVSGVCTVEENSFFGVNASVGDQITIGKDNVVGSGCLVHKNLEGGKVYVGIPAKALEKSSYDAFNVPEDLR